MIALFPNVRSFEWVDCGILHVGPTKSFTFSPGFSLRVAMLTFKLEARGETSETQFPTSFPKAVKVTYASNFVRGIQERCQSVIG